MKSEWPQMEKLELQEITVNILKTLRLLLEDKQIAERVMSDYPELLIDAKDVILDNQNKQFVMKEARHLIFNI